MKIIATCMAGNESDIIEAFVRHHAALLDGVVVLNHASVDGTAEILAALSAEGLPLFVLHDRDRAFHQGRRQTYLARRYLEELDADFCFVLDADEFVRAGSRGALEASLGALAAGAHGLVPLQNYYGSGGEPEAVDPLRRLTRRMAVERKVTRKVVLRRSFAAEPQAMISLGNHAAIAVGEAGVRAFAHEPLAGVTLAHYPARSPDQVAKKALIGWLAHRLTRPEHFSPDPDSRSVPAWHWRETFRRIVRDGDVGNELVDEAIAIATGGEDPAHVASGELVEDPMPVSYEIRYSREATRGALAALAAWTDALVTELNASPPAPN